MMNAPRLPRLVSMPIERARELNQRWRSDVGSLWVLAQVPDGMWVVLEIPGLDEWGPGIQYRGLALRADQAKELAEALTQMSATPGPQILTAPDECDQFVRHPVPADLLPDLDLTESGVQICTHELRRWMRDFKTPIPGACSMRCEHNVVVRTHDFPEPEVLRLHRLGLLRPEEGR